MKTTLRLVGAEAGRAAAAVLLERWNEVTAAAQALSDGFIEGGSRNVTLRGVDLQ